jgi:hypothetical protein
MSFAQLLIPAAHNRQASENAVLFARISKTSQEHRLFATGISVCGKFTRRRKQAVLEGAFGSLRLE